MGKLFSIDDEVKSIITDGLDDLITELGKTCTLVYPASRWLSCDNCVYDPIGHKSANRWTTGGPLPFPNGGTCPQCGGKGMCPVITTENVKFLCEWNPSHFIFPVKNLDIRVPFGILQTKGFLTDMGKVEKCDHLQFEVGVANVGGRSFKLHGEPGDKSNIIQGRYFSCLWLRSG